MVSDKNDAVVHYTLGPAQRTKIFASRYKLHLPTEEELQAELRRELSELTLDFGLGEERQEGANDDENDDEGLHNISN